jgi:hypothetical protein
MNTPYASRRVLMVFAAGALATVLLQACQRNPEPSSTPLPTRQTTIDPVKKKLDTAADDMERRRQAVDNASQ